MFIFSSMKMDIYEFLEELQKEILDMLLSKCVLEEKYYQLCLEENRDAAIEIRKMDFSNYIDHIAKGYNKAVCLQNNYPIKAIYFEYDMYNDWQTQCFLSDNYNNIQQLDDDWACSWCEDFFLTDFEKLSEIYKKYLRKFDTFVNLYLIVRTTLAFREAIGNNLNNNTAAICVAFHDQSIVTRLKEN